MLLRPPLQLAVRRLIGVVGAVFCGYFTYLASRMKLFVFSTGQVIPSLSLSSAYLYMGAAIGLALLSLRYVIEVADPRAPQEFKAATGARHDTLTHRHNGYAVRTRHRSASRH